MSWDQSYSVPAINDLLEQLTGTTSYELLLKELERQGIKIIGTEEIVLDDGFYQTTKGYRIHLSDGRTYEPKLVRSETADGNWGNDVYEYRLKDEQVEVEHVDLSDPSNDPCVEGLECGCDGEVGC